VARKITVGAASKPGREETKPFLSIFFVLASVVSFAQKATGEQSKEPFSIVITTEDSTVKAMARWKLRSDTPILQVIPSMPVTTPSGRSMRATNMGFAMPMEMCSPAKNGRVRWKVAFDSGFSTLDGESRIMSLSTASRESLAAGI